MKADKVRDLDSKELGIQLRDITGQLFHLRFQMRMGQLDGLKKYRILRKDRARILTVLNQRDAAEKDKKAGETAGKG
jgi:large subunit ribosomal protein L29